MFRGAAARPDPYWHIVRRETVMNNTTRCLVGFGVVLAATAGTAAAATSPAEKKAPVAHAFQVAPTAVPVDAQFHIIGARKLPATGSWVETLTANVYVHADDDRGNPYGKSVYVRCDVQDAAGKLVAYADATSATDIWGNADVTLPLVGTVKATSSRRTTLLCRADHNSADLAHVTWTANASVHGVATKVNGFV